MGFAKAIPVRRAVSYLDGQRQLSVGVRDKPGLIGRSNNVRSQTITSSASGAGGLAW
jgi:hypothetical protein